MATITFFAEGDSLAYSRYDESNWNFGVATQGIQGSTDRNKSRVGFLQFPKGLVSMIQGKTIKEVKIRLTFGAYGTERTKTVGFHTAAIQEVDRTLTGRRHLGERICDILVEPDFAYNTTIEYSLTSSSTDALLNKVSSYLQAGNYSIVIYMDDDPPSSASSWSKNFLGVTSAAIIIDYDDGDDVVYYRNGSNWVKCNMYYRNNNQWVKVVPYYRNNDTWVKI